MLYGLAEFTSISLECTKVKLSYEIIFDLTTQCNFSFCKFFNNHKAKTLINQLQGVPTLQIRTGSWVLPSLYGFISIGWTDYEYNRDKIIEYQMPRNFVIQFFHTHPPSLPPVKSQI